MGSPWADMGNHWQVWLSKNMALLWFWDLFDVFSFSLVGVDVVGKAKDEHRTQMWVMFKFLEAVGILIPFGHKLLKGSLGSYVFVEMIYDTIQGAVVGYFWELDRDILRDGEEISNYLLILSAVTSFVDVFIFKGPSMFLLK